MMPYAASAGPPTDHVVSADMTRWLRAWPAAAAGPLDLLGELAACWRRDDLRALRRAGADRAPSMIVCER